MAKKKPAKKAAAAKKKTAKRTTTTKKAAAKSSRKAAKPARKAAGKAAGKSAAKKAAPKKAAQKAAKRAAPKAAPQAAKKAAVRKGAAKKAAAKAAAKVQPRQHEQLPLLRAAQPVSTTVETERSDEEETETVETTSAGTQPLAPEHAAVDDLTSSGNELLDIFQKYDRNRTGSIEQAEFARLLEALGQNITDEELAIAFDIIDTDRTGKISWKQFKNWWTSR